MHVDAILTDDINGLRGRLLDLAQFRRVQRRGGIERFLVPKPAVFDSQRVDALQRRDKSGGVRGDDLPQERQEADESILGRETARLVSLIQELDEGSHGANAASVFANNASASLSIFANAFLPSVNSFCANSANRLS